MALWEWDGSLNIGKNLQAFNERRDPNTGAYGAEYLYDEVKAVSIVTLKAHGMTLAEILAEQAKILKPADQLTTAEKTYTTNTGLAIVGIPTGLQADSIPSTDGTSYFYNAALTVRRVDL